MKRTLSAILFAMSIIQCSVIFAVTPASTQQVQQAYYQWLGAVTKAKGDPSPVLSLYAPDAILIATFHTTPLVGTDKLSAYFENFTAMSKLKATGETLHTQVLGNVAINSGIYGFTYVDDGVKHAVQARFNFVYKYIDGRWLIVNHHSSVFPSTLD